MLQSILDHIAKALSRGEVVKLAGFGVFSVKHKGQRIGRNPKTGKTVPIRERHVIVFRPSAKLIQRVELANRVET